MIEITEEKRQKLKVLCLGGLMEESNHHKQWYLEEILKELTGQDLQTLKREAAAVYMWKDVWDEGVAP